MNAFQWIAGAVLGAAALRELFRPRHQARPLRLLRALIWLLALGAIANPEKVSLLARAIGIGRGADVVLYLFVLAFLAASFHFHSRLLRLERELSVLCGKLALREPLRGPAPPRPDDGSWPGRPPAAAPSLPPDGP